MPFSARYPDLNLHLLSVDQSAVLEKEEIEPLSLENVEVLYVYGLGRGDYYFAVKEWLAENKQRQLVFIEDNLAVFKAFSEIPHAIEIIDHPQVHLKWVAGPKFLDLALEQLAAQFPIDKIEVRAHKKMPRFQEIKLSLMRKSLLWHSVTSESIGGHLLHRNIIPNLYRIPHCSYANAWKDELKGVPVIICGAGPSLKKAVPMLQKLRDRALIIGCGSALSALSHLGIRPHLGMAIDPNAREFDCLKGCSYRDLPLLFGARLFPKVFELFDGPFGYIRSGSSSALENDVEEKLGLNDPSLGYDLGREALSVTTLALSLAHHWGCGPIIFAGVDLAFAKGEHYAAGVPVSLEQSENRAGERHLRRKNKRGEWVLTMTKWVMEQETINNYAKAHPETAFFNTSEGLGFKNIPDVSLDEIALPRSQDYDARISRLMAKTKMEVTTTQVEEIFETLQQSLESCLELLLLLEHAEGGKAVLYSIELEEQPAYELVLKAPRRDFERLQSTTPWTYLIEVTRSYLSVSKEMFSRNTSASSISV